MFGWLSKLFGGVAKVLAAAGPIAATVAKASAAEKINKSKKVPEELKPAVTQMVNDAVDEALAEIIKEATGK